MDPFQGLASFVLGWMKNSATALWLKLLFTMFFSSSVTLAFFTGTVALKTGSLTTGFATGLIAASLVCVALFKLSPLTKGLTVALPTQILDEEARQQIQVVAGGRGSEVGGLPLRQAQGQDDTSKKQRGADAQESDPAARLFNQ